MRTSRLIGCLCLPMLIAACDEASKHTPETDRQRPEAPRQMVVNQSDAVQSPDDRTAIPANPFSILPLPRILEIIRRDTPGEILEVDQDDDDGLLTYEVQILTPDDRKIEITVNAHTGAIIERDED